MNEDPRLTCKDADKGYGSLRPDQSDLKQEIISKRQKEVSYANCEAAQNPEIRKDQFVYLGMTISRQFDTMALRSKPILLRSKSKGTVDVVLRNVNEFSNFLTAGKFNRAHLAALVNAVYCPQNHLNAIYSNVARKTMRHVLAHNEAKLSWVSIIEKSLFPILIKLAELYFLVQQLSIPRHCLLPENISNLDFLVLTFVDGSADYSSALVYIVSAQRVGMKCKVQLITTASKLQTGLDTDMLTVPRNECYAAWQGSELMWKVVHLMEDLKIPVSRCILFIDAISTLLSLERHPVKFPLPLRRWFAAVNINLYKCAQVSHQSKEDILMYIDQGLRINFADYLTKFNLSTDRPSQWLELQRRILNPSWLLTHPKGWLNDALTESNKGVSLQSSGGPTLLDMPGAPSNSNVVNSIRFRQNLDPIPTRYPNADWTIVEGVMKKYSFLPPRTTFRILGWLVFAAQKWSDLAKIRRMQQSAPCIHTLKYCVCAIQYLKENRQADRSFPAHFPLAINEGRFVPAFEWQNRRLTKVGLLFASVLCADVSIKPSLPRCLGNFTISKQTFNHLFVYVLYGRKMRWNAKLQPSRHVDPTDNRLFPFNAYNY